MVSRSRRRGRDRAQLVLVGSIAVAFIIIGLVVVFNTVLFTESFASRGSVEEVEEVGEFKQQVTDEVPELIEKVENDTEGGGLASNVNRNVSVTYSRLLAETYAESGPIYVDVEFDTDNSTFQTRVVHDSGDFTANDTTGDWEPVNTPRKVTDFSTEVNIDSLQQSSGDEFAVILTGNSGDSEFIGFVNDSGELVLTDDSGNERCTVDTAEETPIVNLSTGTTPNASCSFDALDDLDAPHTVEFRNPDQVLGTYTFLASGHGLANRTAYTADSSPNADEFLAEANLDLTYETGRVSYEGNRTVTVREGSP